MLPTHNGIFITLSQNWVKVDKRQPERGTTRGLLKMQIHADPRRGRTKFCDCHWGPPQVVQFHHNGWPFQPHHDAKSNQSYESKLALGIKSQKVVMPPECNWELSVIWYTKTFLPILLFWNHFSIWITQKYIWLFIFIRPSLDGTYYGMALSVRPSVRSSVRPSDC